MTERSDDQPDDGPAWAQSQVWTWAALVSASIAAAITIAKYLGYADSALFTILGVASAVIMLVILVMTKVVKDFGLPKAVMYLSIALATTTGIVVVLALFDAGPERFKVAAMDGDVNVAVAEFAVVGDDDEATREGAALAGNLYGELDEQLCGQDWDDGSLRQGFDFACRPPQEFGPIEGADRSTRADAVAMMANEARADIVLYGTVAVEGGRLEFVPEMFISDRLLENARELSGAHELTAQVGDIRSPATRRELRSRIDDLAFDVVDFILVLAVYGSGDYEEGLNGVQGLIARDTWPFESELLHLVEGNLHLQLENYELAADSYAASVGPDRDYARGLIGLAETTYQRSLGLHRECRSGEIDRSGLEEAIAGFEDAMQASDQPPEADVAEKAWFGIGRSYICLSRAGADDRWESARTMLDGVVASHEAGTLQSRRLAADTYVLIGQVVLETARSDGELEMAVPPLLVAIELSPGVEPAESAHRLLGFTYTRLGDLAEACAHYGHALDMTHDDQEKAEYSAELGRLGCDDDSEV